MCGGVEVMTVCVRSMSVGVVKNLCGRSDEGM